MQTEPGSLLVDPIRLALHAKEEAEREAERRRLDFRYAEDQTRKVEAAILYAQAADNAAMLAERYEDMVLEAMAAERLEAL
jgi:hypothetical protein